MFRPQRMCACEYVVHSLNTEGGSVRGSVLCLPKFKSRKQISSLVEDHNMDDAAAGRRAGRRSALRVRRFLVTFLFACATVRGVVLFL